MTSDPDLTSRCGTAAVCLASYPISSFFRDLLEERIGKEIELLDLQALRRLPALQAVGRVRRHRGRHFLLLFEDPASVALQPVLLLLAVVGGARSIRTVAADGVIADVPRMASVGALASLTRATLASQWAARAARRELGSLVEAQRTEVASSPGSKRVLYLNANLWFGIKAGGSIGHVSGVANGLIDRGFDLQVAAVAPQPLVRDEASFVRLVAPAAYGLPPELNQYRFTRSVAGQLAPMLSADHAFVYQRMSLGNYAGVVLSRAAGIPLVLEYNGSEVWIARHWGTPLRHESLALAAEDVSLRHAHVVVTVSDVLGDELEARGVERDRIVVYPNCVDASVFDPARLASERESVREELGLTDATVITFVGTFGRWHGAEVLAEAISGIATNEPGWVDANRVRFLLVGDGLRMPQVREALGDAGRRVTTLTGLVPQHEAPAFLAASDVLVSPHVANEDGTRFFGSPTKLFEYMAMAKAIVASDLDQIGEVLRPALDARSLPAYPPVRDEAAIAILASPGDLETLVAGIRFAVENPTWRAALGAGARQHVLDRYTWRHHVDAILARLDAVAGSTRG